MKSYNLALVALIFLASCGVSSTDSNDSDTGNINTASAYLTKGPVTGAECHIYALDSAGNKSDLLSSGKALTENGAVDFGDINYTGDSLVECSGGSYINEVDRNEVVAPNLRAAANIPKSNSNTNTLIIVTALTELAVRMAESNSDLRMAITHHNINVADEFGLESIDITAEKPTDLNESPSQNDAAGRYGIVLAALSQLVKDGGEGNTIDEVLNSLDSDLNDEDGVFFDDITRSNLEVALNGLKANDSLTNVDGDAVDELVNSLGIVVPVIKVSQTTVNAAVGVAINDVTISSTGGVVISYSIDPPIENGLAFNPATGAISGTPLAVADEVTYTITATNAAGSDADNVTITVKSELPPVITPSQTIVHAAVGIMINNITMSSTGGEVDSYSIRPAIRNGLEFDSATGTISGIPEQVAGQVTYTITATNNGGTDTGLARIAVTVHQELVPPSIYLSRASIVAIPGIAITPITVTSIAGTVQNYSISPAISNGLEFDSATGTISGTPQVVSKVTYAITATNTAGWDTEEITVEVVGSNIPVYSTSEITGTDSDQMMITFTRPLGDTLPTSADFVITSSGAYPVLEIVDDPEATISGSTLTLSLSRPVIGGVSGSDGDSINANYEDVTIAYVGNSLKADDDTTSIPRFDTWNVTTNTAADGTCEECVLDDSGCLF